MSKRLDYNAIVIQKIEINPELIILRVAPDGELFDFKPGQHTVLGVKQEEPRISSAKPQNLEDNKGSERLIYQAYSIASSGLERGHVDFYVNFVEDSEFSRCLFNLKVGDRVFLGRKATGFFTLDQVPPRKHLLLVATGTGIAPFISMARTLFRCNGSRVFVLIHGVSRSRDLGYHDELSSLMSRCRNLKYFPTVSRPNEDPDWNSFKGYVQSVIQSGVIEEQTGMEITPENFDVFLCGNPDMIRDVTRMMEGRGFGKGSCRYPGTIHTEEYG